MGVATSSSLRVVPLFVTRERAARVLGALGITRVTETTWLDRIGVPVAAGIRPRAVPGSLCVSAGKGLSVDEAMVGAAMEAIEFAWAEPGRAAIEVVSARPLDVLEGPARPDAFLDFCPMWGQIIDRAAAIDCVRATDIVTGEELLVPAEVVFHPYPPDLDGRQYIGTSTNGLASGNSVDEATVHGLCELVERDVLSFNRIRSHSPRVRLGALPERLRALAARLDRAGFDLVLRALPNPFGLPCFYALVSDREQRRITLPGHGCHPWSEIAATRAVCETIQARLTLIHGARDDLPDIWSKHRGKSRDEVEAMYREVVVSFGASASEIDFADVEDRAGAAPDVAAALGFLVDTLRRAGLARVLRVVYTPPGYPVAVVRVIVPGLEYHARDTRRRGPRLARFIQSLGAR